MPAQPSPYSIRVLTEDDSAAMMDLDDNAFGNTLEADVVQSELDLQEPGRGIGVFDGALLVGLATAFSFRIGVPGAVVPAAGVSWVGVLPTHRRRGILRQLMTHQLHEIHDRGREAIAVLYASEPVIYGRFGYGLASSSWSMTVPRDPQALRPDAPRDSSVRLRLVPAEDWKLVADVYDTVARNRAGVVTRDERWHQRAASDWTSMRNGRSALRCVVAEDDNGVRGYARYSTKQNWNNGVAAGVVDVREIVALDAAARAELYRYLFDLDLMGSVTVWNVPVDDPVLHWVTNPRSAAPLRHDSMYVRILDVSRALSDRRYAVPVDVVLGVTDALCPWNDGAWRLVGGPDGATCTRTDDEVDLALSVRELGAAYLGGTSLAELAETGWVSVGPGARSDVLDLVSAAFLTNPRPWSAFIF
jgi:predicted acetyltransferase